jgi:hypothetical protein
MTPFEFVFFLYAILMSLGLTHLVSGWATALRHARSIRWSLPFAFWSVTALLLTTGNLSSFWLMRSAPSWNAALVLSNFSFAIINYIWCVFITPHVERGELLDLDAFHEKERRRFLLPLVVLEIFSIASNVANGIYAGYSNWVSDSVLAVGLLILTFSAILLRRHAAQLLISIAVTAIGLWFVFTASNIIGN